MRTTQANRYARGSAILAIVLTFFVSGAYMRHSWQAFKARAATPSKVPSAVEQQAAEFSFSKVDGQHAEFTVRASHATEFAEGGRSLLQNVWVTFYGQDGERADNLHTRTCELLEAGGTILCAGDVHIDLQSADDARLFPGTPDHPNPAAHIMHIHTSHVSFDRGTGITASDQPVTFEFPEGHGNALGLRYDSHLQELRLLHNVNLDFVRSSSGDSSNLTGALRAAGTNQQPLHVTASGLEYRREQRIINLQGPVDAQQGLRRLIAGHLAVELDPMLRARRIVASTKPKLTTREHPDDVISVAADQFAVVLSPDGWVQRVLATGNVHAEGRGGQRDDLLDAARADVEMTPGTNQPHSLTARQDVVAQSDGANGLTRRLSTTELDVQFAGDAGDGQLQISSAATPAATLDWKVPADGAAKTPAERMHLSSQHLDALFGAGSEVREVRGSGGVTIERQIDSSEPQISTSRELVARMVPSGDWSGLDLTGDVNLRQADQVARADSAHFDRATDRATLQGSVALSNPHYRLTTRSASFEQQTSEFRAEGDVVSSEIATKPAGSSNGQAAAQGAASATNLAAGPARISSDKLLLNTATGHAVYSERARLWQGTSLIEADRIELDRVAQTLTASGQVRAVFPQAPLKTMGSLDFGARTKPHPYAPGKGEAKPVTPIQTMGKAGPGAGASEFMRTEAGRLVYRSAEDRAVLDQGVVSHSAEGSIQSDAMDLYFAPSAKPAGEAVKEEKAIKEEKVVATLTDPPPIDAQGPQQLVRATALGHVMLQEADRRATAAQADYAFADGKFILSGGAPTVRDSSGNSASGRQLTLFFADDRIVIDSAEGMRTLTLHPVEK